MVMAVPVIQEASWETKNKARLAISVGCPSLLSKVVFSASATASFGFLKASAEFHKSGVSTGQGHMALILISGAYSTASCFINATAPALDAQ